MVFFQSVLFRCNSDSVSYSVEGIFSAYQDDQDRKSIRIEYETIGFFTSFMTHIIPMKFHIDEIYRKHISSFFVDPYQLFCEITFILSKI